MTNLKAKAVLRENLGKKKTKKLSRKSREGGFLPVRVNKTFIWL